MNHLLVEIQSYPYRQRTFLRNIRIMSAGLLIFFALSGCDSRQTKEGDLSKRASVDKPAKDSADHDADILYFGFDVCSSPQEDAKQYLPFLEYLQQATGLRIELRFTPKNSSMVDELCGGKFHFGAIGADTYLQAQARCDVVPLVRGLDSEGRAEYQSMIIVAPDSPLQSLDELRGKTFAFGSVTSTQGHLIPRIVLAEMGISLDDLAGYEFTGSHQKCASAVAAGQFDAGGMQDILALRLVGSGLIRILHTSEFYPSSGIVASRNVHQDVRQKIKRALIDFKPTGEHADGLYHWDRTEMASGFGPAGDLDYADLREWSIKFGLLEISAEGEAP
ncbi:MAG: phosphate/phosphite/phosphonate ABC transporter substrate-binding protein [Gemmatimonadales bacterium]|nr:phosphate/phosphite/phosphonate ABC transporter substrate-binding protein [Gemmatimonadales bacterium]